MARELTARGVACCVKTVAKVMREAGIRAKTTRRGVRTTDSRHRLPVSANVRDREFPATKPNEKWMMGLDGHPDPRRRAVSGRRGGPVLATDRRLGDGRDHDQPTGRGRAGDGGEPTRAGGRGDRALGSGESVRERSLPGGVEAAPDGREHERGGPVPRSRGARESLRSDESGVDSRRAVRDSRRGEGIDLRIHRGVLSPRPTVLDSGVQDPRRDRADEEPGQPLTPCPLSVGKISSIGRDRLVS
jgi:hypothetical protein